LLTRSVEDLDRQLKHFERHGVALVSLQESLDATTTGRLMMNFLASVSQWVREEELQRFFTAHERDGTEVPDER
jgi:DNA invertase Pin-like site-specific DNA recombinase